MKFVICSHDFSGLGWAMMLQGEGHDVVIAQENEEIYEKEPEKVEAFNKVGQGIVPVEPMSEAFDRRRELKDAYWVFDMNYLSDYGEKVRKEHFKVWGASELTHKMEHDREFGVKVAREAGFDIPESQSFGDAESAISFLESNPDKSYVCKPDDADSHLTYVPQSETPEAANRELRSYLVAMEEGKDFILQEKIRGVEANCEVFFFEGQPYFAWVSLESKRKNSGEKGELTGCSQEIVFTVPMDSEIVKQTVGKMFPFYRKEKYTGFGDCNVLFADNKVYFIEWCARFGYNAHPTLFRTLLIDEFGKTLESMIDGKTDNFYDRFRKGFGASIRMYLDHPRMGYPLFVSKDVSQRFYHFEAYQDDTCEDPEQDFRLAGYGEDVGIICGFGYTMQDAAKNALENALKVNFPLCAYREDLDEDGFASSPIKRYEALKAMGLI